MSARCDDTRSSRRHRQVSGSSPASANASAPGLRRLPPFGILAIVARSCSDVANFVQKPFDDSVALFDFSLYFIG